MMKSLRRQQAFALVLVLIVLVLVTTMSVLFLTSAGRERRGVDLYARGSQVRHYGNMAVNRVMGQINAATREGTAGSPVSWASQPGMVRTYAANGQPRNIYKLYSWTDMETAGNGFNPTAASEIPPAGWKNQTAVYTDLNQPLNDVYPIVDPRAENLVQGFSIDQSSPAVSGSGSDAPMPVKWLYILEDGQLVPGTDAGAGKASVPGASSTNQIVGRVAYWTDDETSKVNINTASEGAFWDTPKAASRDEMQFAGNPPVKGEFQRTPGHPALTSLSAVFPELLTTDRWGNTASYRSQLDGIYNLSPRIQTGGSRGGTFPIDSYSMNYQPAYNSVTPPDPIQTDSERLFVTADELWFRPDRSVAPALQASLGTIENFRKRLFFLTASSRAPETTLFETPRVSIWPITWPWVSSYFTKRSGSPTVLNPNTALLVNNPWMAAEERLLAFCSTLNVSSANESDRYRFYFQRQNPDSPTHDWEEITRNRQLVEYLIRELHQSVPGWGASLATKWGGSTADQIALDCFDYSRSLINQYTMSSLTDGLAYSYTGVTFRHSAVGTATQNDYREPNAFTVSPLRVTLNGATHVTQGAYPTLDEVAVMFYATQRLEPVAPNPGTPTDAANEDASKWKNLINPGGNATTAPYGSDTYDNGTPGDTSDDVGSRTTQMQAVMLFDFAKMKPGVLNYTPVFWIKVTGGSFQVNGNAISLPSAGGRVVRWDTRPLSPIPRSFAPLYIFNPANQNDVSQAKTFLSSSNEANNWSLISAPIPLDPNALTFDFTGSTITVEIYAPYSNSLETDPTNDPKQLVSQKSINMGAWNGKLPIPLAPRWTTFDKTALQPKPALANGTLWAFSEIAPMIIHSVDFPSDPRNRVDDSKSASVPAAYVYKGDGGQLVSPDIQKRVLSLSQKAPKGVAILGENGSTNLFSGSANQFFEEGWSMITPYDTVISMVADPTGAVGGDARLSEIASFVRIDTVPGIGQPAEVFRSTPSGAVRYFPRLTARAQWHQIGTPGAYPMATGYRIFPSLNAQFVARYGAALGEGAAAGNMGNNDKTSGIVGVEFGSLGRFPQGDFTSMPGNFADGGYIARPDQEFQSLYNDTGDKGWMQVPYFQRYDGYESAAASYFSPNREVPSPVSLGSIPSSLTSGWQTLAFSPIPANSGHPGLQSPPDHLLLDLFWMPVAEPYPISDQFSTAGKVNLNYAIMPFSYIERKTALHALMKATWITSLPDSAAANYKSHFFMRQDGTRTRFPIDVEETLKGFQEKFATGDIFRSGSQLCEMYLVPQGQSLSSVKGAYWNDKQLTADNAREQPYDHLYSRVTTKSNTFTVHWRAQVLRKVPGTTATVWENGRDVVASDLRGSSLIERYIDPNATDIPDYATNASATPLGAFYKWRVVSESFFQP